jgi:hypothetical protein
MYPFGQRKRIDVRMQLLSLGLKSNHGPLHLGLGGLSDVP